MRGRHQAQNEAPQATEQVQAQSAEIITPDAAQRAHEAKLQQEQKDRKKNTKVVEKWIEVQVRTTSEKGKGKVILREVTNWGHTYATYIGREHKDGAQEFLKKMQAEGVPVWMGDRDLKHPYFHGKK